MNKQRLGKAFGWLSVILGITALILLGLAVLGGAKIQPTAFVVCGLLVMTGKHMIAHGFQRMR
jgi:hypothetical protein